MMTRASRRAALLSVLAPAVAVLAVCDTQSETRATDRSRTAVVAGPAIPTSALLTPAIVPASAQQAPARFLLRDGPMTALFGDSEVVFEISSTEGAAQRFTWRPEGARQVTPRAENQLPGRFHRFADPVLGWERDLPMYGQVVYDDVWPGVTLIVEPRQHAIAYRLELDAGADPSRIGFGWEGANGAGGAIADPDGRGLTVAVASGTIRESGLHCFDAEGETECRYQIGATYGFDLAPAPFRVRVIDPVIDWSSFLTDLDIGLGVGVDAAGDAYLIGTNTTMTKVTSSATVAWSVDLADLSTEGIAVDASGNVWIVGYTGSATLPTGGFDPTYSFLADTYVAKFDPTGALVWGTYLGAFGYDNGRAIAVGADGAVYVTGSTTSTGFPTGGGFDTTLGGAGDIFVSKISADGGTLVWSSYLGGASDSESSRSIGADNGGNVYVTGYAQTSDFPTTAGLDTTLGGGMDAFVTKIDASGTFIAWSTFVGGGGADEARGIDVDAAGNSVISGYTYSTDFPLVAAFDPDRGYAPSATGFVTKLASTGSTTWSSYLGGYGGAQPYDVAFDPSGNVYVTGYTADADFPAIDAFRVAPGTAPPYHADAFVTKIQASGASIAWSSFLGGFDHDYGNGIAADAFENVYVVGQTFSTDFPTAGGFHTFSGNGFITRIVQPRANGSPCLGASECTSGICEGVCCAIACGVCSACDATGTACTVVPADDAACGTIDCDGLDTSCRAFSDLVANRCEGAGDCKDPNTADCTVFTNTTAACSDSNACTFDDICSAGSCSPGPALDCDDGNVCTDEICDPAFGCVYSANTLPCDDTSTCTTGDTCADGLCAGAAISCDDSNVCTDDTCDAVSGCLHTDNTAPCDDASACTDSDTCSAGICAGTAITCDDTNPCTDDSCDPSTGCRFTPNTGPCDDLDPCTDGETCSAGACTGGADICAPDAGSPPDAGGAPDAGSPGGGDGGCGCRAGGGPASSSGAIAMVAFTLVALVTLIARRRK
jgi:MYXO-CTERM domain-containing protein